MTSVDDAQGNSGLRMKLISQLNSLIRESADYGNERTVVLSEFALYHLKAALEDKGIHVEDLKEYMGLPVKIVPTQTFGNPERPAASFGIEM